MANNIYPEPVNLLYFGASTLQNKAFSNQNRGHSGSRYIDTHEDHKHPERTIKM